MHDHAVRLILSFLFFFIFFFGGGGSFFFCLGEGRNAYIFPLPLTYEGTIVTVFYTFHRHRAVFLSSYCISYT